MGGTLFKKLGQAAGAAAALALLAAAPAGAARYEWSEASDIVASPDGRHVYAAGRDTLSFSVDQATGALRLIGHTEPGGSYQPSIAMARAGRFVYVASGRSTSSRNSINVLSRDADSGLLTLDHNFDAQESLGAIFSMAASADGTQLYVGQYAPTALGVYDVDPETGALTERQRLFAEELPSQAYDVAPSPDGRHVYLAGDAVGILARDPQTGRLSSAGTGYHHGTMWSVAPSPDGLRVYGGMTNLDTWRRNPDSGALEFLSHDTRPGEQGCWSCDEGRFVSPAPDGRHVFSSHESHAALVQWRVTDAGLAHERDYVNGSGGIEGIANPMGMAWTPDGRFAFVVASKYRGATYISSSGRDGAVAAFRRTPDGLAPVNSVGPSIEVEDGGCRYGPESVPAVSIEEGALYTNSPDVTVTVYCGAGGSVRLSNVAGDFTGSRAMRVSGSETKLRWRLDTGGAARDVKRVHLRFTSPRPGGGDIFDDVILDQRPPELLAARLEDSRLRLRARDNRSGVRRLQVTTSKKRPGALRRFSSAPKVSGRPARVYVRVFDGAGNRSKWRVARR